MYEKVHSIPDSGITSDYNSKNIDHLGIVAAVCREINLAGEIDRIVGVDPRQKVTCGEAVVAMVLNTLGFVDPTALPIPGVYGNKARRVTYRQRTKC